MILRILLSRNSFYSSGRTRGTRTTALRLYTRWSATFTFECLIVKALRLPEHAQKTHDQATSRPLTPSSLEAAHNTVPVALKSPKTTTRPIPKGKLREKPGDFREQVHAIATQLIAHPPLSFSNARFCVIVNPSYGEFQTLMPKRPLRLRQDW